VGRPCRAKKHASSFLNAQDFQLGMYTNGAFNNFCPATVSAEMPVLTGWRSNLKTGTIFWMFGGKVGWKMAQATVSSGAEIREIVSYFGK